MESKSPNEIINDFLGSNKKAISLKVISSQRTEFTDLCRQLNLNVSISSESIATVAKKNIPNILPLEITKYAYSTMRDFCDDARFDQNSLLDCMSKYKQMRCRHLSLRGCTLGNSTALVQSPAKNDESRQMLAVFEFKTAILELIRNNRVVIITGESGTGKTTQVPQYILEDNIGRKLKLVCVQPGHISTIQAAEMVAEQRGEEVGYAIGYQFQLDSKLSLHTCLVYCTPDVLIQTFVNDKLVLNSINYILVDEIHLRNRYIDYILGALREMVEVYPNLKLILLSATQRISIYQEYFGNCKTIHVPTKGYPVQEIFLEEVLDMTKYESKEMAQLIVKLDGIIVKCMKVGGVADFGQLHDMILTGKMDVNHQDKAYGYTPLIASATWGNNELVSIFLNLGANLHTKSKEDLTAYQYAAINHQLDAAERIQLEVAHKNGFLGFHSASKIISSIYHQTITDDIIDHKLIVHIIEYIQLKSRNTQGILVFLPTYDHIISCFNLLLNCPIANELKVLMLHDDMEVGSKHDIFQLFNQRKVILTTADAESSIYFGNVGYVIDSGRIPALISCLSLSTPDGTLKWISQIAADQRRAKVYSEAGSQCFRLYTKERYETFNIANTSEILESQIEDLCLRATAMVPYFTIEKYFDKLVEPPPTVKVKKAINTLKLLGIVDSLEDPTALGDIVMQFFIEPYIAKLIIYGVFLKCLHPVLSMAAIFVHKTIFVEASDTVKLNTKWQAFKEFAKDSKSDHLAMLAALTEFRKFKDDGMELIGCKKYGILQGVAERVLVTRASLLSQLQALNLIPSGYRVSLQNWNVYSAHFSMVKAALTASLYPKLAIQCETALLTKNELVTVDPTSCLPNACHDELPMGYIYQRILKCSDMMVIRYVTAVTPLTVALFGGSRISYCHKIHLLKLDKQAGLRVHSDVVWNFRSQLRKCLDQFLESPVHDFSFQENVLDKLFYILNFEEFAHKIEQPVGIDRKSLFINFKPHQGLNLGNKNNCVTNMTGDGRSNSLTSTVSSPSSVSSLSTASSPLTVTSSSCSNSANKAMPSTSNAPMKKIYSKAKTTNIENQQQNYNKIIFGNENAVERQIIREYNRITFLNDCWSSSNNSTSRGTDTLSQLRFYAIRPKEQKNINISLHQKVWKFTAQTQKKLFKSYLLGDTVILLYTIRNTRAFQGVAWLRGTLIGESFYCPIGWLGNNDVNFTQITNFNKSTLFALEDGYEFSYEIGLEIAYKIINK